MNKQEFELKYREIVLNTNGGNDDYVVALCQIGSLINELDDPSQEIAELKKQLEEKDREILILNQTKIGAITDLKCQIEQKDKEIKSLKKLPQKIVERIIYHYDLNEIKDQFKTGFRGDAKCVAIDGLGLICYLQEILKEYGGKE